MPYKDKAKQRRYQRLWMERRRKDFFDGKTCSECGSMIDLEIHHIDSKKKVSHRIWSWSKSKRLAELEKCIVICRECHKDFHRSELPIPKHGTTKRYRNTLHPCRCHLCREANAVYERNRRHKLCVG